MKNYTKKPVTISAIQVPARGEEPSEDLIDLVHSQNWEGDDEGILITTLEGDMLASPGDYIIRGLKGEYYPCKPDIFEMSYDSSKVFDFGRAVAILKAGGRVARAGWNGKNMFIFLVQGSTFTVNREPLLSILGEGTEVNYHGHVDMRTADGMIVPWLCSQTDMLAEDWGIIPDA